MTEESRRIARAYPLWVRDVGLVGSEVAVARANWDILEVRDLRGQLLMRAEVPGPNSLLFDSRMRFACGRYLIVEIGGGVTAAGFRVWDFVERRWTLTVDDHWDGVSLLGVDRARALVAVSDGKGVDVFDATTGAREWRIPAYCLTTVDFNPSEPERVVIGGEEFGGECNVSEPCAIAVFVRSQLIHQRGLAVLPNDGPELAWLDAERIVLLSPTGEVELLDAELGTARSFGVLAGASRHLRVAEARWAMLHGDLDTTLIDTTGQLPPKTVPGYAAILPGGEGMLVADTHSATLHRW